MGERRKLRSDESEWTVVEVQAPRERMRPCAACLTRLEISSGADCVEVMVVTAGVGCRCAVNAGEDQAKGKKGCRDLVEVRALADVSCGLVGEGMRKNWIAGRGRFCWSCPACLRCLLACAARLSVLAGGIGCQLHLSSGQQGTPSQFHVYSRFQIAR